MKYSYLSLSEDSTGANSFSRLLGNVYYSSNNGNYQWATSVDTVLAVSNTADSSAGAIVGAMDCLLDMSNTLALNPPSSSSEAKMSKKDILSQIDQSRDYPILKDSVYKQGIYATFAEFKNNSPSISNGVALPDAKDSNKVKIYQFHPEDSTWSLIPNAFGLCINNELYILKKGNLIPVEKAGNAMVISRYQDIAIRKNQALYYRNAIGSNNGDYNPYSREHSYLISFKSNAKLPSRPEATSIDMETGELSLFCIQLFIVFHRARLIE